MIKPYTLYIGLLRQSEGLNYAVGKIVYIYNKDDSIATLYSDESGTVLPQDGVNNVTNSRGGFSFFIDNGEYYSIVDGYRQDFSVEGEVLQQEYDVQPGDISGNSISLPVFATNVRVVRDGREVAGEDYSLSVDGLTVNLTFTPQPEENYKIWIGDSPQAGSTATPEPQVPVTTHTVISTQNIINLDNVNVGDTIITRSYFPAPSLSDPDNFGLGAAMYNVEAAGFATVAERDFVTKDGYPVVLKFEYRKYPECYGVEYGPTISGLFKSRNRDRLQICIDNSDYLFFSGVVETFGSLKPQRGQTWQGVNNIDAGITAFADAVNGQPAIDDENTQIGQALQGWHVYDMYIQSYFTDGLRLTPFQCHFVRCRFSARRGKCFEIRNVAYQSENHWVENVFLAYEYAIYAEGRDDQNPVEGTYDFVDNFILQNTYDAFTDLPVTDPNGDPYNVDCKGGLYIPKASSTIIRGEHFFKRHNGPMLTVGGLLVELTDIIFEENNNYQLYISSTNPGSMSIKGCRFWFGDGNSTTGEQTARIAINPSLYNPYKVTFSGCIFEYGKNGVPLFYIDTPSSTPIDAAASWYVSFKDDNVLNPFQGVVTNYIFGTSGNGWMQFIDTNHEEFARYSDDYTESMTAETDWSEWVQTDTTGSAHTRFFAFEPRTLRNKRMIFNNISPIAFTFRRTDAQSTLFEGLNPVPANTRVAITENRAQDNFIIKLA